MCECTDGASAAAAATRDERVTSDAGASGSVSLVVSLPNGTKFTVTLPEGSTIETTTVLAVKEYLSTLEETQNCSVPSQRLMHKGRILDNDRTLVEYGISTDATLFLVKLSSAAVAATTIKTPAATTTATTTPTSSLEGIDDDDDNFGIPIMPEVDDDDGIPIVPPHMMFPGDNAQSDPYNDNMMFGAFPGGGFDPASLLSNPAIMGMMQSVVSNNPEMVRNLIQQQIESNPAVQEIMESNPAIGQMLTDPGQLDEMMRMMQNPDAMQHAMRSQDLALSQIENMPGGFAALTNMYETMQRPLEDGFADSTSATSTQGPPVNSAETATDGATGAAMPNPWNSSSTRSVSDSALPTMNNNPLASIMAGGANPNAIASMLGGSIGGANQSSGANGADPLSSLISSFTGGAGASPYGGMPPNASSMISQMMSPDNMNRVMQMGDQLRGLQMSNTSSASTPNPWAGINDGSSNSIASSTGRSTSSSTANPPALDVNSLLQGLAPHLRGSAGDVGSIPQNNPTPAAQAGVDFSSLLQGLAPHLRGSLSGGATGTAAESAAAPGATGANSRPVTLNVSNLLQGLAPHLRASMAQAAANNAASGAAATSSSNSGSPADKFRVQLKALNGMGFDNEEQNIAALTVTNGNLNAAVDMLLAGDVPQISSDSGSDDKTSSDTGNEAAQAESSDKTAK